MAKRMPATLLVPPLRTPLDTEVKKSLVSWLDESENDCDFSSSDVMEDFERIAALRQRLVDAGNDYDKALEVLDKYQEYHAALLECDARKFPANETSSSMQYLSFPWEVELHQHLTSPSSDGAAAPTHVRSHLTWERANVLWNTATIMAYQASMEEKRDLNGWNRTHLQLQQASSILNHLLSIDERTTGANDEDEDEDDDDDFALLKFWKLYLLAQAQVAAYYMVLASSKPRHVVLAKLAAGALSMLNATLNECNSDGSDTSSSSSSRAQAQVHCKAWSMWMTTLAQYHQACVHRQKKCWEKELVRLDIARDAVVGCQELVYQEYEDGTVVQGLEMLQGEVPKMVRTIRDRLLDLQQTYTGERAEHVSDIEGEVVVKADLPLPEGLVSLQCPMFQSVPPSSRKEEISNDCSSESQLAISKFQDALDEMLDEANNTAEDEMEGVRQTLANHGLPHSVNAYKQEFSGGSGIPIDLWERIEALQSEDAIEHLKNDSWGLCKEAELAVTILDGVSQQLDEDMKLDRCFREDNPYFVGHDVTGVQQRFRLLVKDYQALLQKAREGDKILMRRLESLDSEPKYKLLQFQKVQLDRLLPSGHGDEESTPVDTSQLARLLVALSSLFDEREELLDKLQEEANKFDIAEKIDAVDAASQTMPEDYNSVIQSSLMTFEGIVYRVRANVSQQHKLMESILAENEQFTTARDAVPSPNANSGCIVMIEDAMEEVEQLRKHMKEGRVFYAAALSKLDRLKSDVGDISARLTVERCEYEDNAQSRHFEDEDARLAVSLAQDSPPRQQRDVSHGDEGVDDAKVANLVAMDFDPQKVVAALKKHTNNMEHALNELLG